MGSPVVALSVPERPEDTRERPEISPETARKRFELALWAFSGALWTRFGKICRGRICLQVSGFSHPLTVPSQTIYLPSFWLLGGQWNAPVAASGDQVATGVGHSGKPGVRMQSLRMEV